MTGKDKAIGRVVRIHPIVPFGVNNNLWLCIGRIFRYTSCFVCDIALRPLGGFQYSPYLLISKIITTLS